MILLTALLAALASAMAVWGLYRLFGPNGGWMKKKIIRLRFAREQSGGTSSAFLRKDASLNSKIAHEVAGLLKTARLKMSVTIFTLLSVVAGAAAFSAASFYLPIILAAGIGLVTAFVPLSYLRFCRKRYLRQFGEFLPNSLSIMSSSIKVGHGLETSIGVVAKTAPYPVSQEFQIVQAEMKVGLSLQDALNNLYNRILNPELKILVTGIAIHHELGGNLSEVLDNLENTIRERFALMREAKALSAQGVMSSWVLFFIPIFLVFFWIMKDPEMFWGFAHSKTGGWLLTVCFILQMAGFYWIRQVIKLKD